MILKNFLHGHFGHENDKRYIGKQNGVRALIANPVVHRDISAPLVRSFPRVWGSLIPTTREPVMTVLHWEHILPSTREPLQIGDPWIPVPNERPPPTKLL